MVHFNVVAPNINLHAWFVGTIYSL